MSERKSLRPWIVAFSGTGINLALGVLYTWSVISKGIPDTWGWSETDRVLPYSVACLIFALVMVPAGRLQDKIGPRIVATIGGMLTGLGMIIASQFTNIWMFVFGFGLLAGSGIGFGYASATPPAVKWFPPAKTGMVVGIVVSGFGLASVYISPLANHLIGKYGVSNTILIFGIAFLLVVGGFAQLLANPSASEASKSPIKHGNPAPIHSEDFSAAEVLKQPMFYLVWLAYFFAAGAGLMVIGKLAKMVDVQAGFKAGFILVALLAVGNAGGRLVAGYASDTFGRTKVLAFCAGLQALLMFLMPSMSSAFLMIMFSMLMGFNYGSNLALFPAITKDFFGLKNLGVNYGLVFTAWGFGGLVLPTISGVIYDATRSFQYAFYAAGGACLLTMVIALIIHKPEKLAA
ncbi:MAG: OFA family MFS transporter [Deltaproteobacteria bacterium]|nr:OFA family MFS transporter [Deltaproteobacteria bacterium]